MPFMGSSNRNYDFSTKRLLFPKVILFYNKILKKSRKKSIYSGYFKYYHNKWYATIFIELLIQSSIYLPKQ